MPGAASRCRAGLGANKTDRSVLLGEQVVSKAAAQGSNPCTPAEEGLGIRQKVLTRFPNPRPLAPNPSSHALRV